MKYLLYMTSILALAAFPAAAKDLTFEQARDIALQNVPGVVVDTERSIHNGAVVYEFDIKQDNGAVMDIEIDSSDGKVLELKVDRAATGGSLPEPTVSEDDARAIAIKHIEDTTSGLRAVEIISAQYKIENQMLAHVFHVRRGISDYIVSVDATSGKVLSVTDKR